MKLPTFSETKMGEKPEKMCAEGQAYVHSPFLSNFHALDLSFERELHSKKI